MKNVVSELSLDFNVWEENDSTDRFLLFSESGEIHTSSKNDIEKLQLEIGSYVLFSRFQPNVNWVEISQTPVVLKSEINLTAGQQIQISGNFIVETLDVATMSLTGVSVRSNEGTEIYASHDLRLTVNVPNNPQDYKIVLSSDSGDAITLNVTATQETFNLSNKFTQNAWKPCVTRLAVKLTANNKTVARSSLWVWIGLQNVNERITFDCSQLPNNFDALQSQDALINGNIITYNSNIQAPHFTFVFNLQNGNNLILTWRTPYIFLQLEDMVNGIATVTTIQMGNIISATHNSQRKLRIFYNQNGSLSLGGFTQDVNFLQYGQCVLPLAALLGDVAEGNNILSYQSNGGFVANLIRLVEPSVTQFDVIANSAQTKTIHINYTNPINSLRLVFTELSVNKTYEVMVGQTPIVQLLNFGVIGSATVLFTAQQINVNDWQHILEIDYQNLGDGVWFIDFKTEQFDGEWNKLTNSAGHSIGFGLLMQGSVHNPDPFNLPNNYLLLMKSVTEKILVRYDNQAWKHLMWLNVLWNRLVLHGYQQDQIARLLELIKINQIQNKDSIPNRHVLAQHPQLLAKTANDYTNLDAQGNFLLLYLKTFSNVGTIDIQKLKNSNRYPEAQQTLEQRYNDTLQNAGDSLGWALNLSQQLDNPGLLNVIFNPNLNNLPTTFVLAPLADPVLGNLEKLLSILAFASRLDAHNGNNNYVQQIEVVANNIANNIFSRILSYIFTIGEDLLGFYLLYWEVAL